MIILDKQFPNKAEILRNYGADLIELRCPVFDYETSNLLVEAGVVLLDQNCQVHLSFILSVIRTFKLHYFFFVISRSILLFLSSHPSQFQYTNINCVIIHVF